MDRTTTRDDVNFFIRQARSCAQNARRLRRVGLMEAAAFNRGMALALAITARHIHPGTGARVRNAGLHVRRAA